MVVAHWENCSTLCTRSRVQDPSAFCEGKAWQAGGEGGGREGGKGGLTYVFPQIITTCIARQSNSFVCKTWPENSVYISHTHTMYM